MDAASSEAAPKDVKLKEPADFKLIGKSLKRKDTPDKVNGKVVYGIDAMLPYMKFATIAACPVMGGKVANVEEGGARSIPGVRQIVVLDDLVAVVGDHMWAAKRGLSALTITWDEGPNASVDSAAIWAGLRKASEQAGVVAKTVGDVDRALSTGDRLEAAYEVPFLAHATMEPMNCTVNLKKDTCEIFLGSQVVARVQSEVAKLLGFPLEKVTVHNHLLGGGFGRRLEPDMALSAVRVAQKVDGPLEGRLDARRGHPARRLPAGLPRHDFREPHERQDRRLEVQGDGVGGPRQVATAGFPEGNRHRRHR